MAIERRPHLARFRLETNNKERRLLQTFTRLNPELNREELDAIRTVFSQISRPQATTVRGLYTIIDELRER